MVNQTVATGINIGPLAGPRVQTGLATDRFDISPFLQGISTANQTINLEEDILRQRELDVLGLLGGGAGGAAPSLAQQRATQGSAPLIPGTDLDVNPFTATGQEAIARANRYTEESQQQLYEMATTSYDRNGRPDLTGINREAGRKMFETQNRMNTDPIIYKAAKAQQDEREFNARLDHLRESGRWIDEQGAGTAIQRMRDALDDPTFESTYNVADLDVSKYAYDGEQVKSDIDATIDNAIGEHNLVNLIRASTLEGAPKDFDGMIQENVTVRKSLEDAMQTMREQLQAMPHLGRFLISQNINPEEYLMGKLKAQLNDPTQRRVVTGYDGFEDLNRGMLSAREGARNRAAQRRASGPSPDDIDLSFGIPEEQAKDDDAKWMRAANAQFAMYGWQRLPTAAQLYQMEKVRGDLNEELEPGEQRYTLENFGLTDSGEIIMFDRPETPGGKMTKPIRNFGKAAGWQTSKINKALDFMEVDSYIPLDQEIPDEAAAAAAGNGVTPRPTQQDVQLRNAVVKFSADGDWERQRINGFNGGRTIEMGFDPLQKKYEVQVLDADGNKEGFIRADSPTEMYRLLEDRGIAGNKVRQYAPSAPAATQAGNIPAGNPYGRRYE